MLFAYIFPRGGGATAAALNPKAAADENRKEVTVRVTSLQARLGNRELKSYAARGSPLKYEYSAFCLALYLSLFRYFVLYLNLLSFLLRGGSDTPHSSKDYAAHERGHPRERGSSCFVLSHCDFLHLLACFCSIPGVLLFPSLFFSLFSTTNLLCNFFSGLFFAMLFVPGTLRFHLLSSVHLRLVIFGFSVLQSVTTESGYDLSKMMNRDEHYWVFV